MLYHGCQSDGHNGDNGGNNQGNISTGKDGESSGFPVNGNTKPGSIRNRGEIHFAHNCCQKIGTDYTDNDRNDLNHSLTPDVADYHKCNRHNGNEPVGGAVIHRRFGKIQTDCNNDGSGNNGREKAHYLACTENLNQKSQYQIQ